MENKMSMWRKLGYGLGGFGTNIGYTTVASFILLYCTNVLGLSAAVIGTLIMISKLLDGVSDIVMGTIIDRTRSKHGKARFWYIVSIVPVSLSVFLIFNIPGSFNANTQYIYFFIVYLLLSAVFYTMTMIAYSTMLALVSHNNKDQADMSAFQQIFAMVAVLVLSYGTMSMVEVFGGGHQGWAIVGAIFAVLSFITLLIPALCVKELQVAETKENIAGSDTGTKRSFLKSMKYLLTNKFFVIMLLINIVNYLANGVMNSVAAYFATYVLGDYMAMGTLSLTMTLPIILLMAFIPPLVAKMGSMRKSCVIGATIMLVGGVVIFIGGKAGFVVLLIGLILRGIGMLPGGCCLGPMTAATVENLKLKTGEDLTGSVFACASIGTKVGMGVGTAVVGWLLEAGGFDGMAATQTAGAIDAIRLIYTAGPVIAGVITLVLWAMNDVEKKNAALKNATITE